MNILGNYSIQANGVKKKKFLKWVYNDVKCFLIIELLFYEKLFSTLLVKFLDFTNRVRGLISVL